MSFFEVEYRVVDPVPSIELLLRDLGIVFEKKENENEIIFRSPEKFLTIFIRVSAEPPGILRSMLREIKKFRVRVECEDEDFLKLFREKLRFYMLKGGG